MRLTPGIRAVISAIEARDQGILAPATLAAALRHPVGIDDVAPFIRFDAANYVRNAVVKTDRWELRLLCWRPQQSTSVHGHGSSACAFKVLRGSATEALLGERDRVWTPGAVVEESSASLIHQVSNVGTDALLTLHAYSPPLPVDAPSPREGHHVVIIGGGFAGVALAYHLLQRGSRQLRVTIVERGPWLGRGVAYGVEGSVFRLNVPASRMSLDPDVPNDFVSWARADDRPDAFLQRARYGDYVVARLGEVINRAAGKLRVVRGEVVAVDDGSVRLATGERLDADVVALATGLAPRIAPSGLVDDARIIDAWDECGLATLPSSGRILVLGAGLSALDIVSLLGARGYQGDLTIMSRNGLLPRPHLEPFTPARPLSADRAAEAPRALRPLLQWVRKMVDEAEARGEPWQHAIDSLRPHLTALWSGLEPRDRARFVRAVRPYWDVLRHRAPVESLQLIDRLRGAGRLEIVAGRVVACEAGTDGLTVQIRARGRGTRIERYDAIVRCVGPALEHTEAETPLLRSILEEGHAVRDPAGLGIVTDARGALVGRNGPSKRYFALGVHRRASSWESTSVPDISVHARALAIQILADAGL